MKRALLIALMVAGTAQAELPWTYEDEMNYQGIEAARREHMRQGHTGADVQPEYHTFGFGPAYQGNDLYTRERQDAMQGHRRY